MFNYVSSSVPELIPCSSWQESGGVLFPKDRCSEVATLLVICLKHWRDSEFLFGPAFLPIQGFFSLGFFAILCSSRTVISLQIFSFSGLQANVFSCSSLLLFFSFYSSPFHSGVSTVFTLPFLLFFSISSQSSLPFPILFSVTWWKNSPPQLTPAAAAAASRIFRFWNWQP